ncbi:MAG TPA: hypothetical protein VLT16_06060 [Candidatus Limnocylindrales bacterium]|nr:hypothetical protein [Candidatus Limnocylindrales bacterium]
MKLAHIVIVVASLGMLAAQPRPTGHLNHVYSSRTGLTLIGFGRNGVALAADGAQYNADGTLSEVQKIFPIGKTGAVALAGSVSVQDPLGRAVREEFNAARISELWLKAHPDASVDSAGRDLTAVVSKAADAFFSKRNPGKQAGHYKFSLLFIGWAENKPVLSGTRYFMPSAAGKPMRAETLPASPQPGEVWVFGLTRVEQELVSGKSSSLKKFKQEPMLEKLRSSGGNEFSAQDYLQVFQTVLQAAESAEGKKFDPGPSLIGPPNRFATITSDGFAWGMK